MRGEAERGGTVDPGEQKRRLGVGLSSMCTNTKRKGVKKAEPVIFIERTGGNGHKMKQEIPSRKNVRRNIFSMKSIKHWNKLPGETVESIPGDIQNSTRQDPDQPALIDSSIAGGWTR